MPEELKSLLEKRAKLVTDARAVLDRHKTAGKLPAEDQAHYDRIMQDAMTISAEVEQRSSFADREQKLAAAEAWGQGVAKRNLDPSTRPPSSTAPVPAASAARGPAGRSARPTPATSTSSRTISTAASAITSTARRCRASCPSSIATCWPTPSAAATTSSRRWSSSTRS